jgi:hypothetical protein
MDKDNFNQLKSTIGTLNNELSMNVTLHKAKPIPGKFALHVPDRPDLLRAQRT